MIASVHSEKTPLKNPIMIIGERAKRARHSQVCSIENRIYTRKMVPIPRRASSFFVVVFIHVNRKVEERGRQNNNNSLPKVVTFFTDYKYTTSPETLSYTINIHQHYIYIHTCIFALIIMPFIDRINVRYKLLGTMREADKNS